VRTHGFAAITTLLLSPALLMSATPDIIWQGDVVRAISAIDVDVYERQNVALRLSADAGPAATEESEQKIVPELFRLDLKVTRHSTDDEGFALPVRTTLLGTIFVATFLERGAARTAVRDVIHHFQILSPQTIRFPMPRSESGEPQPWFSYDGSPFFHDPATWICFEPFDGRLATQVLSGTSVRGADGNTEVDTADRIDMPSRNTTLCGQMRDALAESSPDETRSSRFALETDGQRTLSVSVYRPAAGASIVPLPDGVLLKRTREGTGPGAQETLVSHTVITEFPLSMVRSTSVVMDWVLERSSGHASRPGPPGSAATDVLEDWVVALYPPMMERAPGDLPPQPAEWEERLSRRTKTEFLDSMRKAFQDVTRLNAADVEKVMLERLAALLGNDEALVVVCRKDDSATYFTFPASGKAAIRNAAVFCPELRHALASAGAE